MNGQNAEGNDSVLSNLNVERKPITKRTVYILLLSILLLSCLNVFLTTIGIPDSAIALNPTLASKWKIIQYTSVPILVLFPVASFILAALFSLIPYKNYNYSQKYLPFALITMFVIQCIIFALLISDLF
jgi:cytochrome bd-type quinol oxidase subunit 2